MCLLLKEVSALFKNFPYLLLYQQYKVNNIFLCACWLVLEKKDTRIGATTTTAAKQGKASEMLCCCCRGGGVGLRVRFFLIKDDDDDE